MAFGKSKDGARMEPEEGVKRHDSASGYWVEAEAAKRKKDGAWYEVWANLKRLLLLSNNMTSGQCNLLDDGMTIEFFKYMDYRNGGYMGSVAGTGTMVLYLDGEWVNPTISFDYSGGFRRNTSDSMDGTWYSNTAGKISLYSRNTAGTESTKEIVAAVGTAASGSAATDFPMTGRYEGTLEGTFNRLGLSIYVAGYTGNYPYAMLEMEISNLNINGKKVGFREEVVFDYLNL